MKKKKCKKKIPYYPLNFEGFLRDGVSYNTIYRIKAYGYYMHVDAPSCGFSVCAISPKCKQNSFFEH